MIVLSPIDRAIQLAFPVTTATQGAPMPELETGKRLIVANDGLYLEAASPALRVRVQVEQFETLLPFGRVTEGIELRHGPIPADLLRQFVAQSIMARPHETAAGIVWTGQGYALQQPRIEAAGTAMVRYHDDFDDAGLIIDMHSHGMGAAYFSATDDESDLGRRGPYLALVAGYGASEAETPLALRLVCAPYLVKLGFQHPLMKGVLA